MDPENIPQLLKNSKTIAVVGISDKPDRPSFYVSEYLQKRGYKIIPVNPKLEAASVLGEKVYPDLKSIPVPVDIVDIFRRAEDIPPIADEAVAIKAKAIWMQEGIVNKEAAAKAEQAGLQVVMDKCILKEHMRL